MRHDIALILGRFRSKLPICPKWRFFFLKIDWYYFCVPTLRANHERKGCIILSRLGPKLPISAKRRIFGKIQYFNLFGVARMPCYHTKLKNYP